MEPLVSIIVPCWKVEHWIIKCMESIFMQTYKNYEIIIVNDASPDQTLNKIIEFKKLKDKENKIIIINNDKNLGSSKSRQLGIDNAKGDCLYFLDADDWIEPDTLFLLVNELKKDSEIDIVSGVFRDVYKDRSTPFREQIDTINKLDPKRISYKMMARNVRWNLWNRLIRKTFFCHIKMPDNNNAEDYVLMCQLFYYAKKVKYVPYITYNYNHLNENTFQNNGTALVNVKDALRGFDTLINLLREDRRAYKSIEAGKGQYIAQQIRSIKNLDLFKTGDISKRISSYLLNGDLKFKYKLLLILYKYNLKHLLLFINTHCL